MGNVHCQIDDKSAVFLPQKNTCILPEDLRDFYLTTDGFTLSWSVKLDSKGLITVFCHYSSRNTIKIT